MSKTKLSKQETIDCLEYEVERLSIHKKELLDFTQKVAYSRACKSHALGDNDSISACWKYQAKELLAKLESKGDK